MSAQKISVYLLLSGLFICTPLVTNAAAATTTPSHDPVAVEAAIKLYFKDTPVMSEIARCESNFRQFTDAGTVLKGGDSGGMVGVFQFFESIHATPAKALGFDITTLEGNLGYAKYLYTNQGTTPWEPARACWDTTKNQTDKQAKLRERITLLTKLITLLQKKLAIQKGL